jgi:hypothetical protein
VPDFILVHNYCNNYKVYYAKDAITGEYYVGITKQKLSTRFRQHLKAPNKRDLVLIHVKEGLTYKQARGLEQLTINGAGLDKLSNKINSIAQNNPAKGEFLEAGKEFYEEFLKLIRGK